MNVCIVGCVYFSRVLGSLHKDVVGTGKCFIRQDELGAQSYHALSEVARAPCTPEKLLVSLSQDLVEVILHNPSPPFNTKVAKERQRVSVFR